MCLNTLAQMFFLCIYSSYNYSDPHPINGIKHVGISSWDKHLIYRNIIFEDPGIASQKLSINNYGVIIYCVFNFY